MPQEALSSHLCPILSLCLDKAFSAISCDANWTYASPVLLPCRSSGSIIPFGTISNPIAPRPNEKHDISHIYCHNVQQVIEFALSQGRFVSIIIYKKIWSDVDIKTKIYFSFVFWLVEKKISLSNLRIKEQLILILQSNESNNDSFHTCKINPPLTVWDLDKFSLYK